MWRREPAWDDAALAIQEFSAWVRNADTKSTILGGAVSIAATAALSQLGYLIDLLLGGSWMSGVGFALATFTLGSLIMLSVCIYNSLRPRVVQDAQTRFAWPVVASRAFDIRMLRPQSLREEAWAQARALSEIAAVKYRWFSRALVWGVVTITALVGLSVLVHLHLALQ